jgi:Prenyltransferase and squalene oxidase repeat
MKTKTLPIVLTTCVLAWFAWQAQMPGAARATEIPAKYRESIQKGLDFLARQQCKDGHWKGDGGVHPVAMTALAGIALFMERPDGVRRSNGERPAIVSEPKHAANVRKAADWLMDQCPPERRGPIFSGHPSEASRYMQGHGLATLFLVGVHAVETDETRKQKLADVLDRALKYILEAQSTQGGWHDTSKVEGHDFAKIQPTIVQVQAVYAAMHSGFVVPEQSFYHGVEYLYVTAASQKEDGDPNWQGVRLADMAAELVCHDMGPARAPIPPDLPGMQNQRHFKDCRSKMPKASDLKFGRDELPHYWLAQAEYIHRGYWTKEEIVQDPWSAYRTALFDQLQRTQTKDGTWPAGDDISVGPVYSAAVWCTVLQIDGASHPMLRVLPVARK